MKSSSDLAARISLVLLTFPWTGSLPRNVYPQNHFWILQVGLRPCPHGHRGVRVRVLRVLQRPCRQGSSRLLLVTSRLLLVTSRLLLVTSRGSESGRRMVHRPKRKRIAHKVYTYMYVRVRMRVMIMFVNQEPYYKLYIHVHLFFLEGLAYFFLSLPS